MPKLRTKKVIKKRFRITSTGKVIHTSEGNAKLKAHKPASMKRRYNQPTTLTSKKRVQKIKLALGK